MTFSPYGGMRDLEYADRRFRQVMIEERGRIIESIKGFVNKRFPNRLVTRYSISESPSDQRSLEFARALIEHLMSESNQLRDQEWDSAK